MQDETNFIVVYGYDNTHPKATADDTVILTFSGRRILVSNDAIEAKYPVEAGGEKTGPFRYFIVRSASVLIEVGASTLDSVDTAASDGNEEVIRAVATNKYADTALF